MTGRHRTRGQMAVLAAAMLLSLGPASSGWASSELVFESRFDQGSEGWTASEERCQLSSGVQLAVICQVHAGFQAHGGSPPGSLALGTDLVLSPVGSFESRALFTSPAFTAQRTGLGKLRWTDAFYPGVFLPSASYLLSLVDQGDGATVASGLVEIPGTQGFSPRDIDAHLIANHTYRLTIAAQTLFPQPTVAMTGSSSLHFDDVELRVDPTVVFPGTGQPSQVAQAGQHGLASGPDLAARLGPSKLLWGLKLRGKWLSLVARCPEEARGPCSISLRGMLGAKRAATKARTIELGPGERRRVALRVKRGMTAKLAKRRQLIVAVMLRSGGEEASLQRLEKLRQVERQSTRSAAHLPIALISEEE